MRLLPEPPFCAFHPAAGSSRWRAWGQPPWGKEEEEGRPVSPSARLSSPQTCAQACPPRALLPPGTLGGSRVPSLSHFCPTGKGPGSRGCRPVSARSLKLSLSGTVCPSVLLQMVPRRLPHPEGNREGCSASTAHISLLPAVGLCLSGLTSLNLCLLHYDPPITMALSPQHWQDGMSWGFPHTQHGARQP